MATYNRYIARRRVRIKGICGEINIPYGTVVNAEDGFLLWKGHRLCSISSQNAYDYFSRDDDGAGQERGRLVCAIVDLLSKHDAAYQKRWDLIWEDTLCQKYRRQDSSNFWLWNYAFYNAPIENLKHIYRLVENP